MARHIAPARIARLDAVQRARRAAAEAALAAARDDEARAASEAEAKRDELAASQRQWLDYLDRPSFAPEFSRAVAGELLARDATAKHADERHRLTTGVTERSANDWRLAEARVRATGEQLDAARRVAAGRREERQLAEFADRITYDRVMR